MGRGCHLGSTRIDLPDLINIGDGVSIGYDADLDPSHVADGWLHIGRLRIGAGAFIGTNAVISGDGIVGRGARVLEQSLVATGQTIPDGETWAGSPAQRVETDPHFDALAARQPPKRWPPLVLAGFVVGFVVLMLLPSLLIVPGLVLMWGMSGGDPWVGLALDAGGRVAPGVGHLRGGRAGQTAGAARDSSRHLSAAVGVRSAQVVCRPAHGPAHDADQLAVFHPLPVAFPPTAGGSYRTAREISTVAHIDPDLLTSGRSASSPTWPWSGRRGFIMASW